MKKELSNPMNNAVDYLRSCIIAMRAAAKAEQIDPEGPLGVWVRAQEAMLLGMIDFAELQTDRLVESVSMVDRSMTSAVTLVEAEVKKLTATREEARQQMWVWREENERMKEERLRAGDDMAIRMADTIKDRLKTSMLVRERRWNLRQNLGLVGIFTGVLFATFLGGQWMQGHNEALTIIERCHANRAVDPSTNAAFCPMPSVDGIAETVVAPPPPPPPPPVATRRW